MSKLVLSNDPLAAAKTADLAVVIATKAALAGGLLDRLARIGDLPPALRKAAGEAEPGANGTVVATLALGDRSRKTRRIAIGVLPNAVSRHNAPARSEAIASIVGQLQPGDGGRSAYVLVLDDEDHLMAALNAVGRKLPIFSRKGGRRSLEAAVTLGAVDAKGRALEIPPLAKDVVEASRWAAQMVDTPPQDLDSDAFSREARRFLKGLNRVKVTEIKGKALLEAGLGGIHAVGRTATSAPRLLIFDHAPARARRTIALVGKGVIYDTGGLSLKPSTSMVTMKGDMGGAAAVLGAFRSLVRSGLRDRLIAAVALVENAIGPESYRPDDIITLHSGHTIEINNTDAEGRLLLGDGVSYVARRYEPDLVIDMATLTGAQLVSTGLRHSAVVSSREGVERAAILAGRASGDLTHPLLFAPEFWQQEFNSKIADMRNSVADRSNAQSSCAAWFVWAQIDDLDLPWLHVDLAGPAFRDGRGTGHGVALVTDLVRRLRPEDLRN